MLPNLPARLAALFALALTVSSASGQTPNPPKAQTWKFDRLDRIGGHATTVEGSPKVILTEQGKAIQFNGEKDAIFLEVHPLAGAERFTWEVIFRPESGGRPEQRFFHLQETGSQHRMLFETRLLAGKWCLDSFVASRTGSQTLIDRQKLYALDVWHVATLVYDGTTLRHYVDGQLQGEAKVQLAPQGPGRTSLGVRINRIDYFKGALLKARMVPKALSEKQFWKVPKQ